MARSGKKQPTGDYEIGYARPPKITQWRKGQSGNPRGFAPQECLDLLHCLTRALKRKAAKPIDASKMTLMEAVAHKLVIDAAKGKAGARRELFRMMPFSEAVDERDIVIDAELVFDNEEDLYTKAFRDNQALRAEVELLKAQLASVPKQLPPPSGRG